MAITISSGETTTIFENKEAVQQKAVETKTEASATEEKVETNTKSESEDESLKYFNKPKDLDEDDEDIEEDIDEDVEDDESEKKKKPSKNLNKRFNKLTKEKYELSAEVDYLKKKILELETNTKIEPKKEEKVEVDNKLKEPNIDDFENHSDYVKALVKYERENLEFQKEKEERERKVKEEGEKILKSYNDKLIEAVKIYGKDEFKRINEISLKEEAPSFNLQDEIFHSEIGAHLTVYLYNNLEEYRKLNSMSKHQISREIARLELKINKELEKKNDVKKEPKKVTNAPAPIEKRIDTSTTIGTKPLSYQDFKKQRESELNKSRK